MPKESVSDAGPDHAEPGFSTPSSPVLSPKAVYGRRRGRAHRLVEAPRPQNQAAARLAQLVGGLVKRNVCTLGRSFGRIRERRAIASAPAVVFALWRNLSNLLAESRMGIFSPCRSNSLPQPAFLTPPDSQLLQMETTLARIPPSTASTRSILTTPASPSRIGINSGQLE